jgi:type IV pilus assembly protein PilM
MKLNIFQKHYDYLGLHINATALKCVQLEYGSHSRVKGYTNIPLPRTLIVNDTFGDKDALIKIIQKSFVRPQFGHFTTNRVVVSIPETKSFIRVITMAAMDDIQAENAVMFEAEAYIPLPMDQVYFDWQIVERKGDKMDVLIIASPKDYIDAYISILEKAHLKIAAVEVESQAIARALIPTENQDTLLIADIDTSKTTMVMVSKGILQFTSSVPIGGSVFTDKLVQSLGLPLEQAEKIKRDHGLENTTEYPNLKTHLMPAVSDLAAEMKNILKFHYEHSELNVTHLLLTGGGSKLRHLDEFLAPSFSEYPQLQITIANPLQNVPRFIGQELLPYEALSYTTAIGLAMRGLKG